jgi:hypothetical protein
MAAPLRRRQADQAPTRSPAAAAGHGGYTDAVRSVADDLRAETRRRDAGRPPEARLQQALALGDADVAALAEARGLSADDARALIRRHRRVGRTPSCAGDE